MAIRLQINIDEKGAVIGLNKVKEALKNMETTGAKTRKGIDKTNKVLKESKRAADASKDAFKRKKVILQQLASLLPTLTAGFAAYKALGLAKHTLEIAAGFEVLLISLDTITKGKGQEWFDRLNQWALKMPINTEKAIKAFQMMKAMGLDPLISDMTTLVDTASALGGQADTMEGIARALGQIVTKGKVSAEELMQLAERGVPAYKILREELGLTAAEVGNIGDLSIDGLVAVEALLRGMNKRFAGQAEKIRETYSGITVEIKSNWREWIRLVMDSGPFETVKSHLRDIRDLTSKIIEAQEISNKLREIDDKPAGSRRQRIMGRGMFPGFSPFGMLLNVIDPKQASNEQLIELGRQKALELQFRGLGMPRAGLKMHLPDGGVSPLPLTKEQQSVFVSQLELQKLRVGIITGGLAVGAPAGGPKGKFGRTRGLLGDQGFGPTPEDVKKELDKIKAIRENIDNQMIILADDRYKAEIDLLQKRFDAEFGMVKANSELRIVAEEQLSNDIAIVQEERSRDMQNRIMRLSGFMDGMFDNMVTKSGISFDSVLDNFKRMAASMAQRALFTGIAAAIIPGGGGFLAGLSAFGESTGILGKAALPIPDTGVDRIVTALNKSAIGAGTTHITNTFSPRDRDEMMSLDDEQFASRVNRVFADRKV